MQYKVHAFVYIFAISKRNNKVKTQVIVSR